MRSKPVHPLLLGLALVPLVIAFVWLLEWLLRGLTGLARELAIWVMRRGAEGLRMWTTVLAYVLDFVGFITFAAGGLAFMWLIFEEVAAESGRVPLRHYAVVATMISGGLTMIGIAQGLRLLLLLIAKPGLSKPALPGAVDDINGGIYSDYAVLAAASLSHGYCWR